MSYVYIYHNVAHVCVRHGACVWVGRYMRSLRARMPAGGRECVITYLLTCLLACMRIKSIHNISFNFLIRPISYIIIIQLATDMSKITIAPDRLQYVVKCSR